MIVGLIFTLGCLLPLSLIDLVYLIQDKRKVLNGFFFKVLITTDVIMIISEVFSSLLLYAGERIVLGEIFLRFHWGCALVLFYLLYVYEYILIKNCENYSLSEFFSKHKIVLITSIITFIILVLYFVLPLPKINYHELDYLPGWLAYTIIIYATITLTINVLIYFIDKNKFKNARNILITVFIMSPLYVVLQFLFPHIAFGPLSASFIIILFYMLEENPNKIIKSEMNEINNELERDNSNLTNIIVGLNEENSNDLNEIINICNKYKNISEINEEEYLNDLKLLDTKINSNLFNIKNRVTAIGNFKIKDNNFYAFDVLEVLKRFQKFTAKVLGNSGIKVFINIEEDISKQISGDEDSFYYILSNVFMSSLKTTKVGRISFVLSGSVDRKSINIKVIDTGEGRKAEDYLNIENIDNNYSIIKRYLSSFNGSYTISGKENLGTETNIHLEVIPADKDNIEKQTLGEVSLSSNVLDMQKNKILLVENNDMSRFTLNQLFNLYNFDFQYVKSVIELINNTKKGDSFEYIFIDTYVDDYEDNIAKTIKKMCKDFSIKVPKIIALVPYLTKKYENKLIDQGYDGCISSGLDLDELNNILNKLK